MKSLHAAFHESESPAYRWVNGVVWVLILVSVGIFVLDLTLDLGDRGWIRVADRVVLWAFAVELTLRVISFRPPRLALFQLGILGRTRYHVLGRIRFLMRPLTVVDLVTIGALVPALRGLRALRLLRLIRTWKVFRYSDPLAGVLQAFRQNGLLFAFALSLVGMVVLIGGVSLYLAEAGTNPRLHSVGDGIWWALVTLTTVGYGDVSPQTGVGRVLGGILMISGLFTLALFAGIVGQTLLRAVLSIREEQFRMSNYVNHVVICGYDPGAQMLLDAIQREFDISTTDVVLFAPGERASDIRPEFVWIEGDPTKESELDKARLDQALAVIIVGRRDTSPQQADAVTILTAFTIRSYLHKLSQKKKRVRPVYLVAEILDAENVEHALTAGADEVIETTRLGFSLLAHAVRMPGTAAILGELASAEAHSMYLGPIPASCLHEKPTFRSVAERVKAETGALVIGVRPTESAPDLLNPPDDRPMFAGEQLIYLAPEPVLGTAESIDDRRR